MILMDFFFGNYDRNIFNIFIDEVKGSLMLIDNEDMLKCEDEISIVSIFGMCYYWYYVVGYVIYEKEKILSWMERCYVKFVNEIKSACIVEFENGNWLLIIGVILDYRCWVEGGVIYCMFFFMFSVFLVEVIDVIIEELMEKYSIVEEDVVFLKDCVILLNCYGFEGVFKIILF